MESAESSPFIGRIDLVVEIILIASNYRLTRVRRAFRLT